MSSQNILHLIQRVLIHNVDLNELLSYYNKQI